MPTATQPTETDAARLITEIDAARRRNTIREAVARRQGGTYDPILNAWMPWNESGPVRKTTR